MPESIYDKTFSLCTDEIKGPRSAFFSPSSIVKFFVLSFNISIRSSAISSIKTATEIAIHLSPAEPKAEPINASLA